jgi:TetR/AcrR family transcriptional regulator, repressor for uid operon
MRMIVHSHNAMSLAETLPPPPAAVDRRMRILDAAERCFVRNGFHKSTMQDVAAECSMSPGNLYRYFPSKDAIVAGLAERDREQFNGDFQKLVDAPDPVVMFVMLGRRHLVEEPRSKAIMMQEIWAEACRNPRMAEICAIMDQNVQDCLAAFVTMIRARDGVEGIGAPQDVAKLIIAISDGLFRRRATDPAFEPASAFSLALPTISKMIGVDLIAAAEALTASEVLS